MSALMIRAAWTCERCTLTGHHEHPSPVAIDVIQNAAWDAHKALNEPCDYSMDLEAFHVTIHAPAVDDIAALLAAKVDQRLAEDSR